MKKYNYIILALAALLMVSGCERLWDDHYNDPPETVNENLWTALEKEDNLSLFVQYMQEYQYDTLFDSDDTYSLFIPDNEAFTSLLDTGTFTLFNLNYLISPHFVQSGHINGKRKIQTLGEKYALFEKYDKDVFLDGLKMDFESPLYLNGKYFVMKQVAVPKPNLYEYITLNNPALKAFIDDQDSIILDREKSRPVGFDSLGNTIYDSVVEVINIFEEEYFPVSEEFRSFTATLVFPVEEDYNAALTEMASNLEGDFTDYTDIPMDWQFDVLIPHLLDRGVFLNMLEEHEFMKSDSLDSVKLQNIQGDSIRIFYEVTEKTLCSNGYAYNYRDFTIPDSLYAGTSRTEAEWYVEEIGFNKFKWDEKEVKVISAATYAPIQTYDPNASNDTIVMVDFKTGYDSTYIVEFYSEPVFPRKYLMVVRTHMDVGGIWEVYVNDELITTVDYYDYILYRGLYYGICGKRYKPEGRYNYFDGLVENITEYGRVKLRFEYKGPSSSLYNGLVIDYIDFIEAPCK